MEAPQIQTALKLSPHFLFQIYPSNYNYAIIISGGLYEQNSTDKFN